MFGADQAGWKPEETVTFYDPASGLTYRAHAAGMEDVFGQQRQKGVGARMLEWANELLTVAYLVEVDAGGNLVLNADGTPMLKLDASGKPQVNGANPGAALTLQKYVDNIDIMRQLGATFGFGLGEGDLPQP